MPYGRWRSAEAMHVPPDSACHPTSRRQRSAICRLPALTGVGLLLRNLQLGRKATTAGLYLKGIVRSVQNYRDQLPDEQRLAMGRVLADAQRMVPGLEQAVHAAKEAPQEAAQ